MRPRRAEVVVHDAPPDDEERPIASVTELELPEPPQRLYEGARLSLTLKHHVGEDWSVEQ